MTHTVQAIVHGDTEKCGSASDPELHRVQRGRVGRPGRIARHRVNNMCQNSVVVQLPQLSYLTYKQLYRDFYDKLENGKMHMLSIWQ